MDHSSTPLRSQPPPPNYEDEPPSYGYDNGSTIYEEQEEYSSPNRHGGPSSTMRLLPSEDDGLERGGSRYGGDEHDGFTEMYEGSDLGGGDYGGNNSQFRRPQVPLQRRQYVKPKTGTPSSSFPIAPNVVQSSHPSSGASKPSLAVVGKLENAKAATVEDEVDDFIQQLSHSNNVAAKGKAVGPNPVPAPLFNKPAEKLHPTKSENKIEKTAGVPQPVKTPPTIHRKPSPRKPGLASSRIDKADIPSCRTPVSPVRPSPQRYHPLHQNQSSTTLPPSRPTSSLGNPPSIPRPPSVSEASQFSHRPGSPTRPWTPSHTRPARSLSRTSVNYEPPDLNGSPRPGTPSGRYGGSPRRPLPPAPLFSGPPPAGAEETSIDIGDADEKDDVFGGGGRVVDDHRASLRSYGSYMSDSTMVTDEKDAMSKGDPDEEYEDVEEIDPNVHYGPAPTGRQNRRGVRQAHVTKKEVRLINGELVLECKIPTILHSFLPRRDEREFTHMRYTAVTCDPDDFTVNGYKLRQNMGSTMRETELFICVTMYNENEIDFTRTMHGIMRNITHFCSRNKSRTWGKDGWQKIVVCIIADGRQKVHPRTLNALAAMGVYQDGIAKNVVNQKEVTAHVYEYTSQVSLDSDLKFKGAEKGIVPCQIIFCLKERNQKKLNSHRWFFNAFGRSLMPNVCILLDVGTKPAPTALYHLWKAFDQDSNVAGAAGEIKAGKGKGWLGLLNPLVASQNFEYKMSNILDKPLESVFGYITVLPGALSAYRYYALQNDSTGHGPLSQYFKGEMLHGKDADVFTANMYLAEDRILCWELVAKREERWVLKFVKNAVGETDVPDAVPEFISQRRRWLNGAFFAAVYSLIHFRQIWKTDHTIARKILLHIEFVYQFVSLIFTYLSLANFYLTFYFVAGSLTDPTMDPFGHNIGKYIFVVLRYSCVLLICLQFILSMGNRPQGARKMFLFGMVIYGIIMIYTTFAALYMVIVQLKKRGSPDDDDKLGLGNNMFTNIIVSTLSTIGLYFLMSFLYLDPWHMFTSSAQYFALLPSYICTLQVYAFCNTHDVTWGTKGDNVLNRDLGTARAIGSSAVEVEMPSEQLDIDSGYDEALRNLRDRLEVETNQVSESQMQEDYYRAVRTYMVAVWMTANAVLAMSVSEAYAGEHTGDNIYLAVLLWSVASLALFRAIGSSAFGILGLIHKMLEARIKFAAASSGGGTNGLGGSVIGSSSQGSGSTRVPTVGGGGAKNWVREKGWDVQRKLGGLMFWKK